VNALGDLIRKLIDNIAALWPIVVIDQWERGLRVRLGKIRDVLGPGWHWVIPYVDVVWTRETNAEPFSAGKQTIDGQTVEVIGFGRLNDIRQFYVEVNDDVQRTLALVTAAAASQVLSQGATSGATDKALKDILRIARRNARRLGLGIDWLAFHTVTEGSVIRLIADATAQAAPQPGVEG
jgi:regulator of protease activity HflC (stomatin/prohibitin superfamily)